MTFKTCASYNSTDGTVNKHREDTLEIDAGLNEDQQMRTYITIDEYWGERAHISIAHPQTKRLIEYLCEKTGYYPEKK